MQEFRIAEAAALLGVSDDTVRRWADQGRVPVHRAANGMQVIAGADLVPLLGESGPGSALAEAFPFAGASSRNRFVGLVTAVTKDGVMAQVDLQAGPFRVVSLMTREAADELGLAPGMLAAASAKATTVVVEVPSTERP
ncbi:MerR family transcriptional regulator [Agromyces rhizosphaerae]|uniref:MerR family transcriptional regulator n=1 Tax=Agromyces rhizosphaerae TaxID=88374 RepID=A0A9W6FQ81_9MICO|nr:helix-turn-helix transcriptional regulator [Agromyces rhizosphaerae]GLI26312.1 MerR family transcriptional regulator [Agromyces rhizosphaerae]